MFAVTGGKGGVGKTTTALALAAGAARRGHDPVVVDADLDVPDLAAVADVETGWLEWTAGAEPLGAAPCVAGVTVVGAKPGAEPDVLDRALDELADTDRLVVVDCPAGTGRTHGLALRAATGSVVVTHPTRRAVADAVKAGVFARRLGAPPCRVVFNESRSVPAASLPDDWPDPVAVPRADAHPPWRALASYLETTVPDFAMRTG